MAKRGPQKRLAGKGKRPQKRLVYLAGEGKSEQGYGHWLERLARDQKILKILIDIHAETLEIDIHAETLEGGGNPLKLVDKTMKKSAALKKRKKQNRLCVLLLDTDRCDENKCDYDRAISCAKKHKIHLIRQVPDHEGFLLRHFEGDPCHTPSKGGDSFKLLKKKFPDYEKGMDADRYGDMLTLAHLERARGAVDDLNKFLNKVGWPRG